MPDPVIGMAVVSAGAQMSAADSAADAQSDASAASIAEQRRQFDEMRKLLEPYTNAGQPALKAQQDLLGLNGPEAQKAARAGIESSPEFASMVQQGENAILQNASATGGLRGGNTQAALAQFAPSMLNQLIGQQYERLGGMTTMGQNSAVGVGTAGMNSANKISALLAQQGAAQSGGALGVAKGFTDLSSNLSKYYGNKASQSPNSYPLEDAKTLPKT